MNILGCSDVSDVTRVNDVNAAEMNHRNFVLTHTHELWLSAHTFQLKHSTWDGCRLSVRVDAVTRGVD